MFNTPSPNAAAGVSPARILLCVYALPWPPPPPADDELGAVANARPRGPRPSPLRAAVARSNDHRHKHWGRHHRGALALAGSR